MKWQPIESAPQDGTSILVFVNNEQYVVSWIDPDYFPDGDRTPSCWWYVADGKYGPYPLRGHSPTHWMRLPKPPK